MSAPLSHAAAAVKDSIHSGAAAVQHAIAGVLPASASAAPKPSSDASKPIIVVAGVTGQQGGSVARALLESGKWSVRGLTRDTKSAQATKLQAELPALQLFQADLLDSAALRPAFTGAKALFLVTDFYTERNTEKAKQGVSGELEEGTNALTVAKEAGIEYALVSALVNAKEISEGKLNVLHFSGKYEVEAASKRLGLKTIGIYPGQYMQNFAFGAKLETHAEGHLEFRTPLRCDVAQPLFDIAQIGVITRTVLDDPEQWVNRRVLCASEYLTMEQMAGVYSAVTGTPVTYRRMSVDEYRKANAGVPQLDTFVEMFAFFDRFGYFGGESLQATQRDFPHTHTFREWLTTTGWRFEQGALDKAKQMVGLGEKLGSQHLSGHKVDGSDMTKEKLDCEMVGNVGGVHKSKV